MCGKFVNPGIDFESKTQIARGQQQQKQQQQKQQQKNEQESYCSAHGVAASRSIRMNE